MKYRSQWGTICVGPEFDIIGLHTTTLAQIHHHHQAKFQAFFPRGRFCWRILTWWITSSIRTVLGMGALFYMLGRFGSLYSEENEAMVWLSIRGISCVLYWTITINFIGHSHPKCRRDPLFCISKYLYEVISELGHVFNRWSRHNEAAECSSWL